MSYKVLYPGQYLLRRDGEILSRDEDYPVMEIRFDYQAERLKPGEKLDLIFADTLEVKKSLTGTAPEPTLKT